jgi:hypothetical protein
VKIFPAKWQLVFQTEAFDGRQNTKILIITRFSSISDVTRFHLKDI